MKKAATWWPFLLQYLTNFLLIVDDADFEVMKRFLTVLILLLGLLQYRLWLGENSLPEYFSLKQQIHSQIVSNDKLIERNHVLREEINDLRQGTDALEERARNELGMVKKGETFYRVVGTEQSTSQNFN